MQVLHGESNTSQASPRMTVLRMYMCQPQEAVQPQQNQIIVNASVHACEEMHR